VRWPNMLSATILASTFPVVFVPVMSAGYHVVEPE
jgi:hypothetical protein